MNAEGVCEKRPIIIIFFLSFTRNCGVFYRLVVGPRSRDQNSNKPTEHFNIIFYTYNYYDISTNFHTHKQLNSNTFVYIRYLSGSV